MSQWESSSTTNYWCLLLPIKRSDSQSFIILHTEEQTFSLQKSKACVVMYYHSTGHRRVACTAKFSWRKYRHVGSFNNRRWINVDLGRKVFQYPTPWCLFFRQIVRCDGCFSSVRSFLGKWLELLVWKTFEISCLLFIRKTKCRIVSINLVLRYLYLNLPD